MEKQESPVKKKAKSKKFKKKHKRAGKVKQRERKEGVNVILKDPSTNPCCTHGPTLLLSKKLEDGCKNFYVCAAQRARKFCPFYLTEGKPFKSLEIWTQKALDFRKDINHRKMFIAANEVKLLKPSQRIFCLNCSTFVFETVDHHEDHQLLKGITDHQLMTPTEILPPAKVDKREAQYWFSKSTVKGIADILKSLNYKFVYFNYCLNKFSRFVFFSEILFV